MNAPRPDFQVAYRGPELAITVVTDRAQTWWSQNVEPSDGWKRLGSIICAEFPLGWPVIEGAREDGLEVSI